MSSKPLSSSHVLNFFQLNILGWRIYSILYFFLHCFLSFYIEVVAVKESYLQIAIKYLRNKYWLWRDTVVQCVNFSYTFSLHMYIWLQSRVNSDNLRVYWILYTHEPVSLGLDWKQAEDIQAVHQFGRWYAPFYVWETQTSLVFCIVYFCIM